MKYKELKNKRWFKILSNKFLLLFVAFIVWMAFFDSNSWLVQRELNKEIDQLKSNKKYYQGEITKDSALLEQLNDSEGLKRYAREKYFMKRANEDVYIIEYDSTSE